MGLCSIGELWIHFLSPFLPNLRFSLFLLSCLAFADTQDRMALLSLPLLWPIRHFWRSTLLRHHLRHRSLRVRMVMSAVRIMEPTSVALAAVVDTMDTMDIPDTITGMAVIAMGMVVRKGLEGLERR